MNNAPTPRDADQAIRDLFADWIELDARGLPGGISKARLARLLGVSRSQLDRILKGDRFIHPGQIARLPEPQHRAVMNAIASARAPRTAPTRSAASFGRRCSALVGLYHDELERALADGVLDRAEYARLKGIASELGEVCADGVGGWTCRVEQHRYGHRARKATWLYAHGVELPSLPWGRERFVQVAYLQMPRAVIQGRRARETVERMGPTERAATPLPFRDLLLAIARTARPREAVA